MTTVTRSQFVQELQEDGGALNINDLSAETDKALEDAGVSEKDLKRIAGKDAQIRTRAEYQRLFRLLDRVDTDKNPRTFDMGTAEVSLAGHAYEALKKEADAYRSQAQHRGIIHVGMRPESKREVRALEGVTKGQGGVKSIQGGNVDGVIRTKDKRYDLTTKEGLNEFEALAVKKGMSKAQAKAFVDLISRQNDESRDDFAHLGAALFRTGKGDHTVNRLVLSGHSGGKDVYGDDNGEIDFDELAELAKIFPKGAAKIEHVALSACNCGYVEQIDKFRAMFPNLKSYFGYSGFAPSAEKSAPSHLRRWEAMTDGDDSSQVKPLAGTIVATWTKVNGFQGPTSGKSVEDLEKVVAARREAWDRYVRGDRKPVAGRPDAELNAYYTAVVHVLYHPDVSAPRRAELEKHRDDVFAVRMEMHD